MKLSGVFLLLGFLATPILGLPDIAAALKKPEDLAPLFRALDPAHSGEGVSDTDADHRQLQRQFFTRLTNINQAGDSFVRELTVFDDKLYFVASNGEDDNLYEFDGNEARLVLATDRMGYGGPSVPEPIFNPSNLTVCNGYLYYVTPSGSDVDLYEFDGSEYEYLSEPDLRNTLYCWRDTLYWAEFDEPVARRQLAEAGEFIRSYNRDRQYGFEFESYRQNYHSSIGNMYGFDDKLYYWADGSIWSTDLQLSAQQLMDSGFPQFADLNGKLIYTDFAVVLEYDPEIDVVQEEDGNPSLLAETELPFAPVVYNGNVYYTGVILSEGDPRGGVFKYNGRSEPQLISENSLGLLFTVFRGLLYFFEAQLEGEPAFFLSIYDGSRFSRTRIEDESALVIFGALFGGGPGVPGGPGEEEFFRNFRFVESRGTLYLTGFDESGGVELFRLNPTSFPEESESPDSEECFSSQDTVEVLDRGTVQMKDLTVGDHVRTGIRTYEQIFGFAHPNEVPVKKATSFLQIHVEGSSNKPLEVTGRHMVFTSEGEAPQTADSLKVGDTVLCGDGLQHKITKIGHTTSTEGIFAPLTPSGKIVVNDVLSSTYTSLQKEGSKGSQYPEMKNGMQLPISVHKGVHIFASPFRMMCIGGGLPSLCNSFYTKEGNLGWIQAGFELAAFAESQSWLVQMFMLIVLLAVFVPLYALECVFGAALAPLVLVGGATGFVIARDGNGLSQKMKVC